jgi:MoxR-like ATPase
LARVVDLVRRTRQHPDVRVGSSVRGAIDMALVAERLGRLRQAPSTRPDVSLDAARAALSGRIRLHEGAGRTAEDVVEELWGQVFDGVEPGEGESDGSDEGEGQTTQVGQTGRPPPGKDGARAERVAGA